MSEVQVADVERRPFFTVKSLAAYLSVHPRTVRNWIDRGLLASYDLGDLRRIDPSDVEAFLASRRDERRAA